MNNTDYLTHNVTRVALEFSGMYTFQQALSLEKVT